MAGAHRKEHGHKSGERGPSHSRRVIHSQPRARSRLLIYIKPFADSGIIRLPRQSDYFGFFGTIRVGNANVPRPRHLSLGGTTRFCIDTSVYHC
ncbi:hypothetical protein EVAR_38763_1 [Eumeta japonica]|uniref:Uncharacterized protein n=1 Tax=Eumeta variegata TaxID=151549 RepID=A0A4C1WM34_EUMVA|nr:hypothetical protein EVAR_38763_1 [Eumeta japonica]